MTVRHLDISETDQATAPNSLAAARRSASKASTGPLVGLAWDMTVPVGKSIEDLRAVAISVPSVNGTPGQKSTYFPFLE
jgi:hypothetical protein